MKRQNLILLVLFLVLSVFFSSAQQTSLQQPVPGAAHLFSKNNSYKSPARPFLEHKQTKLKVRFKGSELDLSLDVLNFVFSLLPQDYSDLIYAPALNFPLTGSSFIFYLRGPPALA